MCKDLLGKPLFVHLKTKSVDLPEELPTLWCFEFTHLQPSGQYSSEPEGPIEAVRHGARTPRTLCGIFLG